MKEHFRAPWSLKLKLLTGAFLLLFLFILFSSEGAERLVVLGIAVLCAVFAVRGYSVMDHTLLIHRLGWAKKVDLSGLKNVEYSPGAILGSIRVWGVGGLFGFVGYFRNAILGTYQSYATDPANVVVLTFSSKKIVVTPERPAEFVEVVQARSAS